MRARKMPPYNEAIKMTIRRIFLPLLAACILSVPAFAGIGGNSVYMEELTWKEIRDKIRLGSVTVIIPSGGVEQGGPHLVTGKQNVVARHTAGEIAKSVNGLVAPVIAYVPEGRIDPPEG